MKAVAAALEQMPRFNSLLSEDGQRSTLKKYINIGVRDKFRMARGSGL